MRRFILLSLAGILLAASAQAQTPPAAPVLLGPNDSSPFGSFPAGSSDTGVSSCPALTPTAGFTAGTNGATYQNLDVSGQIVVNASNVTFRCVRLRAPGYRYGFQINSSANGTLLENVDVANAAESSTSQGKCILVYGTNTTIRRANVSDCEDGIHISSDGPTLVEWSYIHAMKTSGTNLHSDGVQIVSGGNVTLRNNRIVPQLTAGAGVNSALTLESYTTPLKNVEIGSNQLAGGNFVLYIFPDTYNGTLQPCPSGVNIHDNQWLKGIYQYGYRYYRDTAPFCTPSLNGGAWTNNLVSDGTVLPETDGGTASTSTSSGSAVASLSVSPLSLSASVVAGTNPANATLSVKNSGDAGSTLSWTVTESVPWLSVTPTSGTATTETDTVGVSYNTSSLAAGSYSGTITIANGSSQQQSVPVSLSVTASSTSGSTSGSTTSSGTSSSKNWPDGSTDTGLNAALSSLGGKTCQQYCGGSFPAYSGTYTPAAGTTIECKTIKQKITIVNPNVTLRCNDISSPGDKVATILINNANATNWLVEGNRIHDGYGDNPDCGIHLIVEYNGYGTLQYNDMYRGDNAIASNKPNSVQATIFQWNYWHDSINSSTCPSAHTEAIHVFGGNAPRVLHNRLIHTTSADGFNGTATYYSEDNPGVVQSEEIRFNYMQGGGYILRPTGTKARIEDNTLVTGGWMFGAFLFGDGTPSSRGGTFLRNICTNGHTLLESDGGGNACTH